jgi:hypothetical protein
MRLPWQAREFERTCADCGYTWRVPRSVARRKRGISAFSHAPRGTFSAPIGSLDKSVPEIAASEELSEVSAAYAQCPRCSSERYTQQPVRP